jgi:hypothetical protein
MLVDCKTKILRNSQKQVFENYPLVVADRKTPEEFCSAEILRNYGMQSIPIRKIGLKINKI